MEYAFWATPGLPLFVVQRGHALMEAGVASVSVFYSVTVLTLFGHIPFAMLLGLYLSWLEIRSVEDSIAIASIVEKGVLPCDIANMTGIPVFLTNVNGEDPVCGNTFSPDFAALFRFGALATDQYSRPIVSYQEVRFLPHPILSTDFRFTGIRHCQSI